jgi:hypothetical protein
VLTEWGEELPALVAEWQAEGPDFLVKLALQLKRDTGPTYLFDRKHDPLLAEACARLLARVDWRQVAERLVANAEEQSRTDVPVIPGQEVRSRHIKENLRSGSGKGLRARVR